MPSDGVKITKFLENQVGEYRTSLQLLLGAVLVVLLIACANLANLLAARGAARSREFAIRMAIGATRWQITRQLLIESVVLAVFGGVLGLMLAAWGRDVLVALSPPGARRFQETQLDLWVLAVHRRPNDRHQHSVWPLASVANVAHGCAKRARRRTRFVRCAGRETLARVAHRLGGRVDVAPAQRRGARAEEFLESDFRSARLRAAQSRQRNAFPAEPDVRRSRKARQFL